MSNKNKPLDLSQLYDAGKWFQFPFVLVGLYGPMPAMMLAYILSRFSSTETPLGGGSIWLSRGYLNEAFFGRLSKDKQNRLLSILEKRGVVSVRQKKGSTDLQRWISVNKQELNHQISQFISTFGDRGSSHFCDQGSSHFCDQGSSQKRDGKYINSHNRYKTHGDPSSVGATQSGLGLLPSNKEETTFGDRCTNRLIKTLLQHRKIMRRPNPKSWAKVFTTLETQLGRKRVHAVLNWYRDHLGEEFVPVAYSAQAFADKFLRIEESIKRTNKRDQIAEPIVPTEEESKVMQDLEILSWPKGAGATLPASVRESLSQYHTWVKVLRRFRATHKDTHSYCRFIDQLNASLFLSPRSFLLVWYQKIYDKAQNWEGWIPDLMREAWRPTHLEFQRMGRAEASAYFGDSTKWDTFCGRMTTLAKDEN